MPKTMYGFNAISGVPDMAQQLTNPTGVREDVGSSLGLIQSVKDPALP